jgi:hypothetical protein
MIPPTILLQIWRVDRNKALSGITEVSCNWNFLYWIFGGGGGGSIRGSGRLSWQICPLVKWKSAWSWSSNWKCQFSLTETACNMGESLGSSHIPFRSVLAKRRQKFEARNRERNPCEERFFFHPHFYRRPLSLIFNSWWMYAWNISVQHYT